MNARCPLAALGALVLLSLSPLSLAHAADGGAPPRRVIEERPFGGPPPQRRSMDPKAWGTACKTPSISCTLAKSQQVGTACSCPGSDGKALAGVTEQAD
jgi:hypothetical protein